MKLGGGVRDGAHALERLARQHGFSVDQDFREDAIVIRGAYCALRITGMELMQAADPLQFAFHVIKKLRAQEAIKKLRAQEARAAQPGDRYEPTSFEKKTWHVLRPTLEDFYAGQQWPEETRAKPQPVISGHHHLVPLDTGEILVVDTRDGSTRRVSPAEALKLLGEAA